MLVARIADQLGNQMFTYASVKTIAQDRQEAFAFIREYNARINDEDPQYGNEIYTIFPAIREELITQLPDSIQHTYEEPPLKTRTDNFQKSALEVPPDTLMIGHYISYRYFCHNLNQVHKWFSFPEDIEQSARMELENLQKKHPGSPLIAVHFRLGEDYVRQGFRITDDYWKKAAVYFTEHTDSSPVFLLFYDKRKKGDIIQYFQEHYTCEICRGTLVHDLCMMSLCRRQIICNSSFSIMSAVLNKNPGKEVLRPSVYPVGKLFYPSDCFDEEWTVIPARQSRVARLRFYEMCLKGKILRLLGKR